MVFLYFLFQKQAKITIIKPTTHQNTHKILILFLNSINITKISSRSGSPFIIGCIGKLIQVCGSFEDSLVFPPVCTYEPNVEFFREVEYCSISCCHGTFLAKLGLGRVNDLIYFGCSFSGNKMAGCCKSFKTTMTVHFIWIKVRCI